MTAPLSTGRSLRQAYESFIEQRIEEYKETLPREELLRLGDEAVRELERETGSTSQYLFTEVLIAEHVNRLIAQRLNLPTYRRWVTNYLAMRRAQLDPLHWGLDPHGPVVSAVRGLDADRRRVLIIGAGLCGAALYVAAHDIPLMLVDSDLASIEVAENRAAGEQLAPDFEAYVVSLGRWLPSFLPGLVLIETRLFVALSPDDRSQLVEELARRTTHHGRHIVLGDPSHASDDEVRAVVEEAYHSWDIVYPAPTDTDVREIAVVRPRSLTVG